MHLLKSLFLGLALTGTAAALPQLDLPKKRRSAPPAAKESKPAGETPKTAKDQDPAARGEAPAAGQDAPRSGDTGTGDAGQPGAQPPSGPGDPEVTPVLGPDGKPVGTRTTRRVNAPGGDDEGSALDLGGGGRAGAGSKRKVGGLSGIDLPEGRRDDEPAAERPAADAPAPPTDTAPPAAAAEPATDDPLGAFAPVVPDAKGAARVLLERLNALRRATDPEVDEIAGRLARLGDEGLAVARYALAQDEAPMVVAGASALLESGSGDDADLVVRRLRGRIPKHAATLVLTELLERDPTRGTNELLTDLLSHDSGQVRRAARRALADRLTEDDLPRLVAVLADRSAEKRRGALELIAQLDDDLDTDALLDALDDPSTGVAKVAVEELSRSGDPTVDVALERTLFASGIVGVLEARTLLAIVEREDRTGVEILDASAVPLLVEALQSPIPLAANAAALALAGIGFRSDDEAASTYLDGPVPSRLVGVVAGIEFFDGFDLVREPAIRRLRQITGQSHGADGDAWLSWWADHGSTFQAARVRIPVEPEDAQRVVVFVHDPAFGGPVTLAGPGLAAADSLYKEPEVGRTYYLFPEDARALLDLLAAQGVFSAERLPGSRGILGTGGRTLDVAIGSRRKVFRVGEGVDQPWLGTIVQRAYGLERRYGWESCWTPDSHADRRAFFRERLAAWQANDDPTARAEGLQSAVQAYLEAVPPVQRDEALVALFDLDQAMGVLGLDDVWPLMKLLEDEPYYGQRAVDLVDLGQRAVGIDPESESVPELGQEARDRADLVIDTVERTFGASGLEGIESTLRALGIDAVLAAGRDDRVLRRVAAARILAALDSGSVDPRVEGALMTLANDAEPEVRGDAMRGLGLHGVEGARELLEQRAESSSVLDRAVAVEMLGHVGGPNALRLIVDALTAPDDRLHVPAARGLAALGTAETAPLLTSLLRSTSNDALRSIARDGLVALGPDAERELLIGLRSTDERLRRTSGLILAELLEPRVVPELAMLLVERPGDEAVLHELRVLTCVDYADESSPGAAYLRFWEEAEQKDVLAWFFAGAARRGLRPPPRPDFEGEGTREARAFCVAAQTGADAPFAERALRELRRMTGVDLGRIPDFGLERRRWLERANALVEGGAEPFENDRR